MQLFHSLRQYLLHALCLRRSSNLSGQNISKIPYILETVMNVVFIGRNPWMEKSSYIFRSKSFSLQRPNLIITCFLPDVSIVMHIIACSYSTYKTYGNFFICKTVKKMKFARIGRKVVKYRLFHVSTYITKSELIFLNSVYFSGLCKRPSLSWLWFLSLAPKQ